MESPSSRPNRTKSRQSIAHVTSSNDVEYDKENASVDLSLIRQRKSAVSNTEKKSRSKSLGPGGLEALKESAGNTANLCSAFQIKSILKPTVPLTPPKAIPTFEEARKRSAGRSARKSPGRYGGEDLLIDFSTPAANYPVTTVTTVTGSEYVQDVFSPVKKTNDSESTVRDLCSDEEKEVTRGREVEELKKAQERAIADQKAARRKSMANRRVSFAPEATLHTWNVIEMMEDSTTSSASNSTRRQSAVTATPPPNKTGENLPSVPETHQCEPPSTPPEQIEQPLVKGSPPHQHDLHQQQRRRRGSATSKTPPNGGKQGELSPASAISESSVMGESSPINVEESIHSSSDEDGDTAMSMDDATAQTMRSEVSSSSTGSSLDDRLRRAAAEAGTLGIEYDENGDDLPMEIAEGTSTDAFQFWARGHSRAPVEDHSALQDQENINPFSPAFVVDDGSRFAHAYVSESKVEEQTQGFTMDITDAGGGNLLRSPPRENVSLQADKEANEEDETEGSTMDMTVAAGIILPRKPSPSKKVSFRELLDIEGSKAAEEDETQQATMDMTVAAGAILSRTPSPRKTMTHQHHLSMDHSGHREGEETQGATMEMTLAAGAILSKTPSPRKKISHQHHLSMDHSGHREGEETQGATMEMTLAAGGILSKTLLPGGKLSAQDPFSARIDGAKEEEGTSGVTMDMTVAAGRILPEILSQSQKLSAQDSFSMTNDGAKEEDGKQEATMDMTVAAGGILSQRALPSKGRRRSVAPSARRGSTAKRRSSGEGDITEDESLDPTVSNRGITIEHQTPKKEEPKRLKGRKSLHIGAAKGLLGKRPVELDLDADEEDVDSTPKRLRAVERGASPVKRVHLPHPPTKDETTGRITRAKRRSLEEITGNQQITATPFKSPGKQTAANTRRATPGVRDTPTRASTALPISFEDKSDDTLEAARGPVLRDGQEREFKKISLQEFLKMTNIHFLELSTTKRRHTLAPTAPAQCEHGGPSISKGACFAAAATTLPLLELYQHATRELKSYISTGRKIIGSIEQETLEEQPALFREYVDARPDVKLVMDNQFRNCKVNARLHSKAGWYAWRRQLVDGLRGGLDGIKAGMEDDSRSLTRQEAILGATVPDLVKHLDCLEQEAHMLQQRAEDFESADRESLSKARDELEVIDLEVAQKTTLLGQLQQQMTDKMNALSATAELEAEIQSQIAEAERVQDECRGWRAEDVRMLQERVQAIEKRTGWTLVTAEHELGEGDVDFGPALTMRYRNALRLFFYPAVFKQSGSEQNGHGRSRRPRSDSGPSAPISLTYTPVGDNAATSLDLTTQQRFFLQLLQGHLHALAVLPVGSVSPKTLLNLVSEGWDLAIKVSEEIRQLEIAGITNVSILSDEKLGAKCMLVLPKQCRIDVQFTLAADITLEGGVTTSVVVEATPKYGSVTSLLAGAKVCKIREALNKQATSKRLGEGGWVAGVRGLEEWVKLQKRDTTNGHQDAKKPTPKPAPASAQVETAAAVEQARPGPTAPKKELKKPVPIEEVMEEAAARQEGLHRQEEELLTSATKTASAAGRRPGALRRSP